MKLRKFIATTIHEYLNEQQILKENTQLADKINNVIQTEDFKKWFDNSKVIDNNGNPLILYHGSRETTIREFKPNVDGIWFTDNLEVAQSYSSVSGTRLKRYSKNLQNILNYADSKKYKNIKELFNDLKNIGFLVDISTVKGDSNDDYYVNWYYVLTDKNGEKYKFNEYTRPIDLRHHIIKRGKNYACFLKSKNPFIVSANGRNWDNIILDNKMVTTKDISLYAMDNGYDGVIINNIYEDNIKCNVYVVFENNQIKIIN